MRFARYIIGILIVLFIGIYVIAFTPFGNSIMQPLIEDMIKKETKLNSKLNVFTLGISDFKIVLDLNANNRIIINGNYSLFTQTFDAIYKVKLDNPVTLQKLLRVHLRKPLITNGTIKGDFALTEIDGVINIAGGKIDAKLHNNNLNADIIGLQTLDLLHMFKYPKVFEASLNAKLDYNLLSKKGKLNGHLVDGKFTKNEVFRLVKRYAGLDLYKERFEGDVSANINRENVLASLNLKSSIASIKTTDAKLNIKTQMLNSELIVVAKEQPVEIALSGKISNPEVSIDLKKLIESKAGKVIKKGIEDFFKALF